MNKKDKVVGFKRFHKKFRDMTEPEILELERNYTYKKDHNSYTGKAIWLDSQGYPHVRAKKGMAKKISNRRAKRVRKSQRFSFLEPIYKLIRIFTIHIMILFVSLFFVEQVFANFENPSDFGNIEVNLSAGEQKDPRLVPQTHEEKVEQVVKMHFGEHSEWAFRCLKSENGSWGLDRINQNTDKYRSVDVGLFQVNAYWHCGKLGYARMSTQCIKELKNLETNVEVAREILDTQGKGAWYGPTC